MDGKELNPYRLFLRLPVGSSNIHTEYNEVVLSKHEVSENKSREGYEEVVKWSFEGWKCHSNITALKKEEEWDKKVKRNKK